MAEFQLYSYYRSSCSYRVRIALQLKRLPFVYQAVHLVREGGEQRQPDYLKLNPMGQVPCLIHDGKALAQSMAIIEYLDRVAPTPRLFPEDPWQAAQVRELCEHVNTGIQPIQNLKVLQRIERDYGASGANKVAWAKAWIEMGFEALEHALTTTAGLCSFGDEVTAADLFLVPQVYNADRFKVDMTAFPTIARINEHCLALEAFQKAEPANQPDTPANYGA
ncbi:maleylacetoacetate isomerase [Sulfidibacter corallicola]|uniref:Maleylacetoacetate isomerase n=1 Tax=Sulfidibacter corallicola TaxID=2818388 RepID=A0A8A4TWT6_SULCO|nr:maleylacetoacetate isomerase [Sulfidibacter corallicola]QTD53943.1 maleylacetoacetate isomerase [Sulfidibacter corallicola]